MAMLPAVIFPPCLLRLAGRHPARVLAPMVPVVADVEDWPRHVVRADRGEGAAVTTRTVPVPVFIDIEERAVPEIVVVAVVIVDHVHALLGDEREARLLAVHHHWRRWRVAD